MADADSERSEKLEAETPGPVVLPTHEVFPPPPEMNFQRPQLPGHARRHTQATLQGKESGSQRNESAAKAGAGLAAGVTFAAGIIAGFLIGQWVDHRFNHTNFPWGMLVFTLLGAAAGFMNLFRVIGATERTDKKGKK
jgi:F0F1-type ATP synthase assembly protein I